MPWYGFIHPALAVFTMVYGVKVAQVSISKFQDWNFPLRQQRARSTVYFLLCVGNMVLGFVVNLILHGQGFEVQFTFHMPLSIAVIVLALAASLVTFGRPRRPGELTPLLRLHPWLVVVSVVLIMTMGFIGLLAAFGV